MTQLSFKTGPDDEELKRMAMNKPPEFYEEHRQKLRRIANNPILSEEVKMEIRIAAYCFDDCRLYLKRINDLQETIENMKKARTYVK